MKRPSAYMKMTDGVTGHDYERELNKYIDFLEAENKQLNLAVVSGSFIKNNEKRPDVEGVYKTIHTDGHEKPEYFDGKTWKVEYNHPVKYWWLNYR